MSSGGAQKAHGFPKQILRLLDLLSRSKSHLELFFDLWTAHPQVDSVDDWLARMEQLWQLARPS